MRKVLFDILSTLNDRVSTKLVWNNCLLGHVNWTTSALVKTNSSQEELLTFMIFLMKSFDYIVVNNVRGDCVISCIYQVPRVIICTFH